MCACLQNKRSQFESGTELLTTKRLGFKRERMEWISIKDELPEIEEFVLLFDDWQSSSGEKYKDVRVGYLDSFTTMKSSQGIDRSCVWGGTEFAFNITHWMPLPEPPNN